MSAELNDQELSRYSRQLLLPQFDVAGQLALKSARAMIVGLGGLGSPAALYMAAAGVGELVLVDGDNVDDSNLQRQIVHSQSSVGINKAQSAKAQILAISPHINVIVEPSFLNEENGPSLVESADVVLDCSDNFTTRILLNQLCVKYQKPLVSGAAIRFEGQISVFNASANSPCYQCLYGLLGEHNLSCSEAGVMSPLVGVVGSYQALEAIKVLAGVGEALDGRVQFFDGLKGQWREFKLQKDSKCPACSGS